jgi:hypothetical protein
LIYDCNVLLPKSFPTNRAEKMIVRKYRIGILYIEAKKRLDVSPTLSSNNTLLKRRLNNPIPQKYQLWNSL